MSVQKKFSLYVARTRFLLELVRNLAVLLHIDLGDRFKVRTAKLHWVGPEVPIGQACAITEFIIYSIRVKKKGGKISARGVIAIRDYGEHGWDYRKDWEVKAVSKGKEGFWWTVRYEDKEFFMTEKDYAGIREYLYKGSPGYRVILPEEKWIVVMIEEFLRRGRKPLEAEEYKGLLEFYTGPCVCKDFSSKKVTRNIWLELTNQGKFPENCFQCSCGQRWHFNYANRSMGWTRVSEEAFAMLTKYNGKVMQSMSVNEGVACLTTELGGHWVG